MNIVMNWYSNFLKKHMHFDVMCMTKIFEYGNDISTKEFGQLKKEALLMSFRNLAFLALFVGICAYVILIILTLVGLTLVGEETTLISGFLSVVIFIHVNLVFVIYYSTLRELLITYISALERREFLLMVHLGNPYSKKFQEYIEEEMYSTANQWMTEKLNKNALIRIYNQRRHEDGDVNEE